MPDQLQPLICDHAAIISGTKESLRDAQDEVYQLKNQLTKSRLDIKSKDDDIRRLVAKREALQNHNLEISSTNQKLTQKCREIDSDLQSALRSKIVAEQSLGILQGERESLVKSRNWYRYTYASKCLHTT